MSQETVSFGFYNAVEDNGVWDREYTAEQMSSIFDGIIQDGVYETILDRFQVIPSSGLTVTVKSGRAWFEHTWTLNGAPMNITLDARDASLSRIDAIIIKIDASNRVNEITVKKGILASDPVKPTLDEHTYPLAYIRLYPTTVTHPDIVEADIENAVGTSACPFVTGVISVMSIDQIVTQWQAQWNDFLTVNEGSINAYLAELDSMIDQVVAGAGADLKPIIVYDVTIGTGEWVTYTPASGTEEYAIYEKGYVYRARIPVANVLNSWRPYITWSLPSLEDAGADILNQAQCTSANGGGVYIYAESQPSASIKALTVECRQPAVWV